METRAVDGAGEGGAQHAHDEDPRVHAVVDAIRHTSMAMGKLEAALERLEWALGVDAERSAQLALGRSVAMLDEAGWGSLEPTPMLDEVSALC